LGLGGAAVVIALLWCFPDNSAYMAYVKYVRYIGYVAYVLNVFYVKVVGTGREWLGWAIDEESNPSKNSLAPGV
jgi:hypothetical protein